MTVDGLTDRAVLAATDQFFAARRSLKDSPHTTAAYRRDLTAIVTILAGTLGRDVSDVDVDQLTAPVLREAFGAFSTGHAKASITRCWSTWNQFLNFLVGDGILPGNPMAAVPRPRRVKAAPKPLQGEDTPETLLRSAALPRPNARDPWPERDLAILATSLLSGLRSAELLTLQIGSLTGAAGERRIRVLGKGGKSRSVPIEDALDHVIDAYLATRRTRFPSHRLGSKAPLFVDLRGELQRGGLQYLVEMALRAAGVADRRSPGALVHALRHTYATRLADDGATASEVMALLGHASLTTSQAYVDATAAEQRRSAAACRRRSCGPTSRAPTAKRRPSGVSSSSSMGRRSNRANLVRLDVAVVARAPASLGGLCGTSVFDNPRYSRRGRPSRRWFGSRSLARGASPCRTIRSCR